MYYLMYMNITYCKQRCKKKYFIQNVYKNYGKECNSNQNNENTCGQWFEENMKAKKVLNDFVLPWNTTNTFIYCFNQHSITFN